MFQTLSPRDDVESTGIGLTLIKKTIEMYGGRVWVESQRGAGSTFLFTLPKAQTGATNEKLQTGVAG
jgi:signal transduction histidine kinase